MTPYEFAERFRGEVKELPGTEQNPLIQWFHQMAELGPDVSDETPWCSSFVNAMCWLARVTRSKSAAARSWLKVGEVIDGVENAHVGFDIVVLKRLINGMDDGRSGHVGFYAGHDNEFVYLLGGNQGDQVTLAHFPRKNIVGIRRVGVA